MNIIKPESSLTPFKKHEQIHHEGNAMQMRIEAMQMEIEKLKAANVVKHHAQESLNLGTSKWKVLFYGFLGWLMYYLYTSFGLWLSTTLERGLVLLVLYYEFCSGY